MLDVDDTSDFYHDKSTSVSLHVSSNSKFTKQCAFCDSTEHSSARCDKYTIVENRQQLVVKLNLCFNCLRAGKHRANNCLSQSRCRNCSRKHHTALCKGSENYKQRRPDGRQPLNLNAGIN